MTQPSPSLWRRSPLAAATAGLIAAVPMLVAMDLFDRGLPGPSSERRLPPLKVTARMGEKAGVVDHVPPLAEHVAGFFAHLGFGSSMGLVYGSLSPRVSLPPLAKGVGFGLLVWLFSYAGWLPALGILSPPHRRPPRRNAIIVLAHILWGAILGPLTQWLTRENRPA